MDRRRRAGSSRRRRGFHRGRHRAVATGHRKLAVQFAATVTTAVQTDIGRIAQHVTIWMAARDGAKPSSDF